MPTNSLEPEQLALLALLHPSRTDYVEEWRHLFQGAMIRSRTVRGRAVTLQRDAVEALVLVGVLAQGFGGSFYLTTKGREI